MAPKAKEGNGKGKTKGKSKPSPEEKERLELLERVVQCSAEIDAEKELGEQFDQQSELLKQYWAIDKKTKSEKISVLREKEHRLKEIKDKHAIELGKCKQTIKDQLFSNQDELSRNVTESLINFQIISARDHEEEGLIKDDLHETSNRIYSTGRSHEEFKIAMRQWRDDVTNDLREQASRRIASLAAYSEKQFKSTREQYDRMLKEELKDVESMLVDKISNAMEQNKQQFQQLRKSWNTTINGNLDLIVRLRNQVNELKTEDRCTKKMLYEIHNENQNIIVPLQNNNKKLQQLESNLDSFSKQKQQLDTQKQYLKRAEEELKAIEWDHEVLFQQLEALQKDNVAQKKAFSRTIYSAQQESNYENLLLENRIRKLSKSTNVNSAAIVEILQKADIGLDVLNTSKATIIDVVKTKNNTVRLLQEQLNRVNADYNNILKKCALKTTKATCVKPIINS